jgi:hypothetical protein
MMRPSALEIGARRRAYAAYVPTVWRFLAVATPQMSAALPNRKPRSHVAAANETGVTRLIDRRGPARPHNHRKPICVPSHPGIGLTTLWLL